MNATQTAKLKRDKKYATKRLNRYLNWVHGLARKQAGITAQTLQEVSLRVRYWQRKLEKLDAAPLTYDVYVRDEALLAELGIVEHER